MARMESALDILDSLVPLVGKRRRLVHGSVGSEPENVVDTSSLPLSGCETAPWGCRCFFCPGGELDPEPELISADTLSSKRANVTYLNNF